MSSNTAGEGKIRKNIIDARNIGQMISRRRELTPEEKMNRLTKDLSAQFERSGTLESEIKKNLKGLGYEIR